MTPTGNPVPCSTFSGSPPPRRPIPPAWLSGRERAVFVGLRVDKRRGDWLAGRRVGKGALVAALAEGGLALEGMPPRAAGHRLPPREVDLPAPPPDPAAARLEILRTRTAPLPPGWTDSDWRSASPSPTPAPSTPPW